MARKKARRRTKAKRPKSKSPTTFDEILAAFQAAEAKYHRELFFLHGVTESEFQRWRASIERVNGLLCVLPVIAGENTGVVTYYYVHAPVYRERWGRWEEPFREPFDTFEELAARAGAALPLKVRQSIPGPEPAGPVAWWLAFLWSLSPRPAEELNVDVETSTRVLFGMPFLDSIKAIERAELVRPSRPDIRLLAFTERLVWDALAYKARTAHELMEECSIVSEDAVRGCISRIRKKGYEVLHEPQVGYFRPDAPPPR